jgi:hypothetical protein
MDARALRSEEVASWYFRLNGFLSIPGFVIHPDKRQRFPLTEADLIGVRFPYSQEEINNRGMPDDPNLIRLVADARILFVLVEVKTDLCNINGPWSERDAGNMQRVIRRLGFDQENKINAIADEMYRMLRWEDACHVLQYLAVGRRVNSGVQRKFERLVQITWDGISDFLFERFRSFPEKLPDGAPFHKQWPDFGRAYSAAFPMLGGKENSRRAIWRYIQTGNI